MMLSPDIESRFWTKVDVGLCWLWTGCGKHYGQFRLDGRMQTAHRVAWEMLVGPIPPGHELDHVCRQKKCVNPDHLEPVTPKENVRRALVTRSKPACIDGHPLSGDNLYVTPDGRRQCRMCIRRRYLKHRRAVRGDG